MNELNSNENETTQENMPEKDTVTEATESTEVTEKPAEESSEETRAQNEPPFGGDENWKNVNQKLKQKSEENDKLRKENELYHKFLNQREQQQQTPLKQEEVFDINKQPDEDLVEYGAIKKARKQDQQYYKQLEERLIMAEMRYKNRDFDEVFTQDNLKELRAVDPDLAEAILSSPSQEKQARMAYNAIKRYGIYKSKATKETDLLSEYNATRPKPSNAAVPSQPKSALSHAAGFAGMPMTKELREKVFKESREKARRQ